MKKILLSVAIVFGINAIINAQSIKVKIQNVHVRQGIVHVALCKNAAEFMNEKFKGLAAKVSPTGEVEVDFMDIPKGIYAIRVYHDTDNSGDLTTSSIGIPKEPFGFSNNPTMKMGPPSFEVASFNLKSDISLTINLLSI